MFDKAYQWLAASVLGAGLAGAAGGPPVTEGTLQPTDPYGKALGAACPLKRTDVDAEISGYVARVTVTQEFHNESGRKIEAVYLFPLPPQSAVDDMVMRIGDRTVKAVIKTREEARRTFEQARNAGHTAALLEQERPNLFTQSVTNIEPGARVLVTIRYVETLKYDEGSYEFSFPMTVGPRYNPAGLSGGERVVPKYAPPQVRAGHDVSLKVRLDAGVALDGIEVKTHPVSVVRPSAAKAEIRLAQETTIPNKDFILRYDVAGAKLKDALLAHRDARGGFFTLILQPPDRVTQEDVTPKELIYVIDTSGSMMGFPIEKAKETMRLALAGLYPRDTFNLITFSGDTRILFPQPVPATPENLRKAQEVLAGAYGSGGTEMMKAVRAAFAPSGATDKVRIICFMTDGYVGNDMEILSEIKRHPEARVFSFGIGSSVNRFLLDKMAQEGRGEVEYVGLQDDGSAAARRFHERIRNPLLTDIRMDWGGLAVQDVYPSRIHDLFSAKPVLVHGRYARGGQGVVRLSGRMSGRPYSREIRVTLPEVEAQHDALASLWARTRIDDLMSRNWAGMQTGAPGHDLQTQITNLGLEFRLMTQFTSFVAVEERVVTRGGKPEVVQVPVEMPEGVSHQGVFGEHDAMAMPMAAGVVGGKMARMSAPFGAGAAAPLPAMIARPEVRANERKADDAQNPWRSKLDAALLAKSASTEKLTVEVWLTEATPEILSKLKTLGFEEAAAPKVAKIRTGRLRGDLLQKLAEMSEVVSVTLVKA